MSDETPMSSRDKAAAARAERQAAMKERAKIIRREAYLKAKARMKEIKAAAKARGDVNPRLEALKDRAKAARQEAKERAKAGRKRDRQDDKTHSAQVSEREQQERDAELASLVVKGAALPKLRLVPPPED